MTLGSLFEMTWRWYNDGKAKANKQNLLRQDIEQRIRLYFADIMRQRYYESKGLDGRPDTSFSSALLSVISFDLSAPDHKGMRRIDFGDNQMYRLPSNSQITNIYPETNGCGNDEVGDITQVESGEENFYINNPDHNDFHFFVVKGGGLNTYHIPPCVKKLGVEATFDIGDELEVDSAIASVIVDQLLGVALGIKKQYYSEEVRKEMESQNIIK